MDMDVDMDMEWTQIQIYPEKTGQNSTDTKTCLEERAATQSGFVAAVHDFGFHSWSSKPVDKHKADNIIPITPALHVVSQALKVVLNETSDLFKLQRN